MTSNEAAKIMDEMEAAGFDTNMRRWNDGDAVHAASYEVSATDRATGINIVISTVEQWNERKQAAAFEAQHSGAPMTPPTRRRSIIQADLSPYEQREVAEMREWTGEDNAKLVRRALRLLYVALAAEQREREQQEATR
jgi:hypothetical protein